MVIAGGKFKPDENLSAKEVVGWLLEDEEVEAKCKTVVLSVIIDWDVFSEETTRKQKGQEETEESSEIESILISIQ